MSTTITPERALEIAKELWPGVKAIACDSNWITRAYNAVPVYDGFRWISKLVLAESMGSNVAWPQEKIWERLLVAEPLEKWRPAEWPRDAASPPKKARFRNHGKHTWSDGMLIGRGGRYWLDELSEWEFCEVIDDEPVAEPPSYSQRQAEWIKANGIKVGDRVRVTRVAESQEDGWGALWNRHMALGEYVIDGFAGKNGIQLGVGCWNYPYFVLEKVVDRVPTDEDARQRPWVMVRDTDHRPWHGPDRLIAVMSHKASTPYRFITPKSLYSRARFATPAEIAAMEVKS